MCYICIRQLDNSKQNEMLWVIPWVTRSPSHLLQNRSERMCFDAIYMVQICFCPFSTPFLQRVAGLSPFHSMQQRAVWCKLLKDCAFQNPNFCICQNSFQHLEWGWYLWLMLRQCILLFTPVLCARMADKLIKHLTLCWFLHTWQRAAIN